MKCPYIHNTIETIHAFNPRTQSSDVENADGTPDRLHFTTNDSSYTRVRHFHDCLEAECGAYQDGHCIRRQI